MLECVGRQVCRASGTETGTTQRCGTFRHTAYWKRQSGYLSRVRYGTAENAGRTSAPMLYQNLIKRFNNPIASGNAENGIRGKRANGIAETINDFLQGCKNLVSKAALSYLLPDLLYRIHLWCVWRDMEKYNILILNSN